MPAEPEDYDADIVILERLEKHLEHGDLRAPQQVAEPLVERAEIDWSVIDDGRDPRGVGLLDALALAPARLVVHLGSRPFRAHSPAFLLHSRAGYDRSPAEPDLPVGSH